MAGPPREHHPPIRGVRQSIQTTLQVFWQDKVEGSFSFTLSMKPKSTLDSTSPKVMRARVPPISSAGEKWASSPVCIKLAPRKITPFAFGRSVGSSHFLHPPICRVRRRRDLRDEIERAPRSGLAATPGGARRARLALRVARVAPLN